MFIEEKAAEKSGKLKSGRPRMTIEALRELEASMEVETLKSYQRLLELYPKISKDQPNDCERDWMLQAEKMIEGFRETKQLFSTSHVRFPSACSNDRFLLLMFVPVM